MGTVVRVEPCAVARKDSLWSAFSSLLFGASCHPPPSSSVRAAEISGGSRGQWQWPMSADSEEVISGVDRRVLRVSTEDVLGFGGPALRQASRRQLYGPLQALRSGRALRGLRGCGGSASGSVLVAALARPYGRKNQVPQRCRNIVFLMSECTLVAIGFLHRPWSAGL